MSFFRNRPLRQGDANLFARRFRASHPVVALALALFLLAGTACTPDVTGSATPANTSPLAAATGTIVQGEPALANAGEPTVQVAGEPEFATVPSQELAQTPPPTSALAPSATIAADLTALLDQPVATVPLATESPSTEIPSTVIPADEATTSAPEDRHSGALSGASATLTPTVLAGSGIMARLAAMNDAATATAATATAATATVIVAATSAPVDSQVSEDAGAVPALQPALAPPATESPPAITTSANANADLTWDGVERTRNVPILMYHYLSVPPAGADAIRRDLSVSPQRFAEHLDRLQEEGYTTISLYTLMAALNTGAPLPEKPVIITFDDSYRDNYENAFPLLRDRGMTATFFVITDFIDEERPDYLSWDQVREMLAGGMSIESHGRNHATLEGRNDDYLVWQALGSLETLQFELGVRPRFVSYPAGDYDANTERIFASAGYWAGVTTEPGATQHSDNPFELPRVRIHSTTTANQLSVLLTMEWDE